MEFYVSLVGGLMGFFFGSLWILIRTNQRKMKSELNLLDCRFSQIFDVIRKDGSLTRDKIEELKQGFEKLNATFVALNMRIVVVETRLEERSRSVSYEAQNGRKKPGPKPKIQLLE